MWMGTPGLPVGAIFGDVSSTGFGIAVSDAGLKRLDYVETDHQGNRVLGIVEDLTRDSSLSYEDALAGHGANGEERLTARVHVIGFKDAQGRVQVPRTPFAAGSTVRAADEPLITSVLGLARNGGAFLGHVKGTRIPVQLSLNTLAQKHLSVLAKTGAGKSYTVGVILEEFLAAKVPLVILDPHGEYGSLRHPNVDDRDLGAMVRFGMKPRAFHKQIKEFAIDTQLNPEADPLRLDGVNMEARQIVDVLPAKLSGGQVGVLYQAVKDVQEHHPAYTLQDVIEAVSMNKSSAKWNVLNALEALQATKLFHVRGTPVKELVRPGQCTIINLKGVSPDIQEVVGGRLASMLWEARKRDEVPPHILVVEEAHNFCPERGVGNAVSGPILRTVASEGRKFGLGLVIVSQRPAKIDKNVLSQCNTQFVLKVTNPNDLKALVSSVESITSDTADEVQRLPVGVALVAGGGLTQPVFTDVRPRATRHGGASVDVVGRNATGTPPRPSAPEPTPLPPPPEPPRAREQDAGHGRPPAAPARAPRVERPPAPHAPDEIQISGPVQDEGRPAEPDERDPVQQAIRRATAQRPSQATDERRRLTKADRRLVQRVAKRLGIVEGDDPEATMRVLEASSLRQGLPPDLTAIQYVDIARLACHEETPLCIRCPMREQCAFHARLEEERQKQRGGIRRLWRRS